MASLSEKEVRPRSQYNLLTFRAYSCYPLGLNASLAAFLQAVDAGGEDEEEMTTTTHQTEEEEEEERR